MGEMGGGGGEMGGGGRRVAARPTGVAAGATAGTAEPPGATAPRSNTPPPFLLVHGLARAQPAHQTLVDAAQLVQVVLDVLQVELEQHLVHQAYRAAARRHLYLALDPLLAPAQRQALVQLGPHVGVDLLGGGRQLAVVVLALVDLLVDVVVEGGRGFWSAAVVVVLVLVVWACRVETKSGLLVLGDLSG